MIKEKSAKGYTYAIENTPSSLLDTVNILKGGGVCLKIAKAVVELERGQVVAIRGEGKTRNQLNSMKCNVGYYLKRLIPKPNLEMSYRIIEEERDRLVLYLFKKEQE